MDNYTLRYDPASGTFQVLVKTGYSSGLALDDHHRIWLTYKESGLVCRIKTFVITQDRLTTDDFESGGGWLQFYPVINLTALSDQVAHISYKVNDGHASDGARRFHHK